MAYDNIIVDVEDHVCTIKLNRPDALNALNLELLKELGDALADGQKNDKVRCFIITGSEKAFAAGTDIGQFKDFSTAEDAFAYEDNGNRMMADIESCPVPTIAAIHGACTGGGAAVAASCDIRLTAADLKFGFPIARTLGNCLSNENLRRLSWIVGPARVSEMLLTARLVGAEEARAIGLVSEVLPDRDAVMARAAEMAETMKGHAPITMRVTKEALRRLRTSGAVPEDRDLIEAAYTSADFREGMSAFLEKRRPNWQNR